MDDDVDFARKCRSERRGVVREEVVSAPPTLDPCPGRQIETEMGVGQKEHPDAVGGPAVHMARYSAIAARDRSSRAYELCTNRPCGGPRYLALATTCRSETIIVPFMPSI